MVPRSKYCILEVQSRKFQARCKFPEAASEAGTGWLARYLATEPFKNPPLPCLNDQPGLHFQIFVTTRLGAIVRISFSITFVNVFFLRFLRFSATIRPQPRPFPGGGPPS